MADLIKLFESEVLTREQLEAATDEELNILDNLCKYEMLTAETGVKYISSIEEGGFVWIDGAPVIEETEAECWARLPKSCEVNGRAATIQAILDWQTEHPFTS